MILMNDFKAEPEALIQAELTAMERVVRSGWYVLGNENKAFEAAWAERCGVSHAVGVGNGMDAIEIGLRALNIGQGDEVITTPMTAFATVLAILRAGATPVLADIDAETALLDIESVKRCITPRTKAVLLVHLYGQVRNMAQWEACCNENEIALLEDCAQSHLAQLNGKVAGSFGAFGAYSFYPTKNLGALGDGGALVSNDTQLAEKSAVLRNYGQSARYHHPEFGLNSRLDELQAAILLARLDWLQEFTQRRKEIAARFHTEIVNSKVTLLAKPQEPDAHVYHLFVILCEQRNALQKHLTDSGIQSLIHYPIPIHHQERCKGMLHDPKGLSNTEFHAKTCLSLPCHPQMTDQDIADVIAAVNSFKG
jgi:dTDP-4-amino-4,6-dideoxygalactose transaminase